MMLIAFNVNMSFQAKYFTGITANTNSEKSHPIKHTSLGHKLTVTYKPDKQKRSFQLESKPISTYLL